MKWFHEYKIVDLVQSFNVNQIEGSCKATNGKNYCASLLSDDATIFLDDEMLAFNNDFSRP